MMDITCVLKQVRDIKFIKKIILSKYQRKLLPYFHSNYIDTEGSETLLQPSNVLNEKAILENYLNIAVGKQHQSKVDKKIIK
eukprot:CAMPEP_0170552028 /NCGR_PEP_ID=MMETSP0211-20121228/10013_1 /TAXON_ID=311385 /ORGANISM="Pseudokeronopsis sp., Strain OXSARD2" /LENGTH=81 /DNA_ID=CAMNT_0010859563 /DNA_START=542 /DNA_END=787 /DNA_ORIENTATION=-